MEGINANDKIYKMSFSKVYPLLVTKCEKKGRTREEVDQVTCWLTGYSKDQVNDFLIHDVAYGDFFLRSLIKRGPGNRGPTEGGTTHEATSGMSS